MPSGRPSGTKNPPGHSAGGFRAGSGRKPMQKELGIMSAASPVSSAQPGTPNMSDSGGISLSIVLYLF